MSSNAGVPGVGVTPLVGGSAVSPSNPLPVTPGTPSGFPADIGPEQVYTAAVNYAPGSGTGNVLIAGTSGKQIFVTSYIVSLTTATDVYFCDTAGVIVSSQGVAAIKGNESTGYGEAYLFATPAGQGLNLALGASQALAGVQVRYRVG